jgi:uncharacterized protein with HEPN domain
MIRACSEVIEYVRGVEPPDFQADRKLISAVNYQIAVLGEAATRLSRSFCARYPEIRWRDIAGMRHHLIHGYDQVALAEVWETAVRECPHLTWINCMESSLIFTNFELEALSLSRRKR